jgi:hypothetical protein
MLKRTKIHAVSILTLVSQKLLVLTAPKTMSRDPHLLLIVLLSPLYIQHIAQTHLHEQRRAHVTDPDGMRGGGYGLKETQDGGTPCVTRSWPHSHRAARCGNIQPVHGHRDEQLSVFGTLSNVLELSSGNAILRRSTIGHVLVYSMYSKIFK